MAWLDPLLWQATVFSATALALILGGTWWLYASPLSPPRPVPHPPAPRLAYWCAAGLGIASLLMVVAGLWDGSRHIQTGAIPAGADFLWPPHLLLYGSFLLTLAIAEVALSCIALPGWRAGRRDPRRWVRSQPALGAVALASLYALLAVPGDALWHELIGLDLTAWSPPHVMLGMMMVAVTGSAVGLLRAARGAMPRRGWSNAAIIALLAIMLTQLHLIGVSEWEWAGVGVQIDRPLWLYPAVGGVMAGFILSLGKSIAAYRWSATLIALSYYLLRAALMLGLALTGHVMPAVPLIFLLGACLLDVLPGHWMQGPGWQRWMLASVFTAGYLLLGLPLLTWRSDLAPLDHYNLVAAVVATWLGTLIVMPAASLIGRALFGTDHDRDRSIQHLGSEQGLESVPR